MRKSGTNNKLGLILGGMCRNCFTAIDITNMQLELWSKIRFVIGWVVQTHIIKMFSLFFHSLIDQFLLVGVF